MSILLHQALKYDLQTLSTNHCMQLMMSNLRKRCILLKHFTKLTYNKSVENV